MQACFHYENFNNSAEESQIQQISRRNVGNRKGRKKCTVLVLGNLTFGRSIPRWTRQRRAIRCRYTFVVLASASSGERTRELFVRPSPPILHRRPRPSAFIGCANEATLSSLNTCSSPAQARASRSVVGPRCSLRVGEHIRRSL